MAKKTKKAPKKAAKTRTMKKAPAARKSTAKTTAKSRRVATSARKPGGQALVSVAPGFTANDAAATIKWYCDVMGFKVIERWEHNGQFLGAQIGSGGVLINIGQDDWKMGKDRVKGQGTRSYFMTGPDIDGYAKAIKARGGVLVHEPQDEWGMRAFSIDDPDGFKLTFMTPLKK